MRLFVLDSEAQKSLSKLKSFAENNILSFDDLLDIKNKAVPYIADRPGHLCEIPDGFRVVYSIEAQPLKDGSGFLDTRHLSVSVPDVKRCPSPGTMELIIKELGFKNSLADCYVYLEPSLGQRGDSVNVIEKFE